jgi:hypothetical protein
MCLMTRQNITRRTHSQKETENVRKERPSTPQRREYINATKVVDVIGFTYQCHKKEARDCSKQLLSKAAAVWYVQLDDDAQTCQQSIKMQSSIVVIVKNANQST